MDTLTMLENEGIGTRFDVTLPCGTQIVVKAQTYVKRLDFDYYSYKVVLNDVPKLPRGGVTSELNAITDKICEDLQRSNPDNIVTVKF